MYNCSKKTIDPNKAIVNRFIAELYSDESVNTDKSVKVLLEAPTMMGIRMAMSSGDNSEYHVVNVEELPDMQTSFQLTRHQGTLLSILNSGVLPKCHVFYADYCGAPIKTSGPIAKDPALEAKLIYNHLLPRGVGIFTFCQRGCPSADKVAEKLLAPYFKIAAVHKYSNMMVYIGVKRNASDKVVSDIWHQFEAVRGKYWSRSCDLISAEERALVMVHQNKDMKCMKVQHPEECEACLNWFNDQQFFVNTSATSTKEATACICIDCWEDVMPTDSYEIKDDKCVWKSHLTRQNDEVDQWLRTTLNEELEKCNGATITGKKRVFRTSKSTDETKEKRKNAARKRRKKQYAEIAKEAKKHFDTWFKEEVTVGVEFKDMRIGKEELEEHYFEWHKKKKVPDRLLLSTKAKKEGMHFSTEVLKRINATLKRKNQVTYMDNGASVACFPYISHNKIKHK